MIVRRVVWARLLAPLLLLSALHLHVEDEPLTSPNLGQRELVYKDPAWHTHVEHVDAARATQRPFCPACLHQVQTSGAHLRAVALVSPPNAMSSPLAERIHTASEGASGPRSARGPPSHS